MEYFLSNSTDNQTMTIEEFDKLNETYYKWLYYSEFNQSCILDLMPDNFQRYKFYFIACYCVLLVIGAIENIGALRALLIKRRNGNVTNTTLLIQLTIANMIVTFCIIPIEVAWRISLSWPTGEFGCKSLQFVRALGPYLSSMVLIGISLDRYMVLTKPFFRGRFWKRGIIIFVWTASILLSLPQVRYWFLFLSYFKLNCLVSNNYIVLIQVIRLNRCKQLE